MNFLEVKNFNIQLNIIFNYHCICNAWSLRTWLQLKYSGSRGCTAWNARLWILYSRNVFTRQNQCEESTAYSVAGHPWQRRCLLDSPTLAMIEGCTVHMTRTPLAKKMFIHSLHPKCGTRKQNLVENTESLFSGCLSNISSDLLADQHFPICVSSKVYDAYSSLLSLIWIKMLCSIYTTVYFCGRFRFRVPRWLSI